jgi:hypothetical protein
VLPQASQLRLNGGTLLFRGPATGTSSQTIGGEFIVAGGNIGFTGATAPTLNLPATWTRGTGGSIGLDTAGGATLNSAVANVNNIIGTATAAYAVLNTSNWARQSGSNTIVPFAGYLAIPTLQARTPTSPPTSRLEE